MRISDWSSDVCSSDLYGVARSVGLDLDAHQRAGGEPGPIVAPAGAHVDFHLVALAAERALDGVTSSDLVQRSGDLPAEHCRQPRSEERRVGKECVSTW